MRHHQTGRSGLHPDEAVEDLFDSVSEYRGRRTDFRGHYGGTVRHGLVFVDCVRFHLCRRGPRLPLRHDFPADGRRKSAGNTRQVLGQRREAVHARLYGHTDDSGRCGLRIRPRQSAVQPHLLEDDLLDHHHLRLLCHRHTSSD